MHYQIRCKNKKLHCLTVITCWHLLLLLPAGLWAQRTDERVVQALNSMKEVLDSVLFVNRFETIETPCFVLNPDNDTLAYIKPGVINSNYRVLTSLGYDSIEGKACLSQYCSRYFRLRNITVDAGSMKLSGIIESSYSYPAPSLMQYLTMVDETSATGGIYKKEDRLFEKLLHTKGRFELYPENDKYRIRLSFPDKPYDGDYTMYGYLEIVRPDIDHSKEKVYTFYFDRMSIRKGDDNNRIFLKFSSTNSHSEHMYFTRLVYDALRKGNNTGAGDTARHNRAMARWVESFLQEATLCQPFLEAARVLGAPSFWLPNTLPFPPK